MSDQKPVAVEAATVVLVRDGREGLETLMLRRASGLDFVGGMWVFPGGRVDPADRAGLEPGDELGAARRAAVRETREEAGLEVGPELLVPLSHWTPPPLAPKRFLTWFFLAPAPAAAVAVDGGEIQDHAWLRPGEVLRRREAKEVELVPPTWVTLHALSAHPSVAGALAAAGGRAPERFTTRIARVQGGAVALWHGDSGYEEGAPERPGPRHRLWMLASGWRYERS